MEVRNRLEIDRQTEMASMLGLSQEQYNRYEKQQRQPTLKTALQIANKLNMCVEDIFYIEPGGVILWLIFFVQVLVVQATTMTFWHRV